MSREGTVRRDILVGHRDFDGLQEEEHWTQGHMSESATCNSPGETMQALG